MTAENPYAALGLPPTWAPAPNVVAVGKVEQRNIEGAQTWYVLRFDTPYGVIGYALDDAGARAVVDALTKQLTGLAVARSIPLASTNGRLP